MLTPSTQLAAPETSIPSATASTGLSPTSPLGTSTHRAGERVYLAIALVALAYVLASFIGGVPLLIQTVQQGQWAIATCLAVTIVVSLLTSLQVAMFGVFSVVLLVRVCTHRGSIRFVPQPPLLPDDTLPTMTIQIPGRNEPLRMVQRSIESALALDYPTSKVQIQYLDNSDPGRWEEIRTYCEIVGVECLHRDGVKGYKAGNLNMGLRTARGDLIGLLDVGDTFPPASVRRMAAEFVLDPSLGFVQAVQEVNNPFESLIARCESHMADALQRFGLGIWNYYGLAPLGGHGALVSRRALTSIGGWDEHLVSEDWAAGCAMNIRGWRGKWVDYTAAGEAAPTTLEQLQKRSRKWATGATELLRRRLPAYLWSTLPWHHKLDWVIRLSALGCNVIRHIGVQMFLLWCGLAIASAASAAIVAYGLGVTSAQWAYPLLFAFQALAYASEGRWARAVGVVVFFPLYVAYNVLVIAHTVQGVMSGVWRRVNVFTITPKEAIGHDGWFRFLGRQRWALGLASWVIVAVCGLAMFGQRELAMAALPLFVYSALVLAGIVGLAVAEARRDRLAR